MRLIRDREKGGGGGGKGVTTTTIYFINPSGKLKLSFDHTTKNIIMLNNEVK